ncbi:MAG TPA: hypothetical protein VFE88_04640 [Candidatus Nanoarchaeia archaeon]|nr:hypothetical protein [Candidatus Nanoarchaeia archaeon]
MNLRILILFFLFTPLVHGQDIQLELPRETYSQGETVQAHIKTDLELVVPLSIRNFRLVDPQGGNIPLGQGFLKLNNQEYYAYFDLPLQLKNGTYTLSLDNVRYKKNGGSSLTSATKTITLEKRDSSLSIRPAIFFKIIHPLEQPGFSLILSNTGTNDLDVSLSTDADFLRVPAEKKALRKGTTTTLPITTSVVGKKEALFAGNILLTYDSRTYTLPVILQRVASEEQAKVPEAPQKAEQPLPENALAFLKPLLDITQTLSPDQALEGSFPLINNADTTLTNITLTLSEGLSSVVTVKPSFLSQLSPRKQAGIIITLNPNKNLNRNYEGTLTILSAEGTKIVLPIKITLKPARKEQKETPQEEPQEPLEETPSNTRQLLLLLFLAVVLILLGAGIYFYKKKKSLERRPKFPFT